MRKNLHIKVLCLAFLVLFSGGRVHLPAQGSGNLTIEMVLDQIVDLLTDYREEEAIALFDIIPLPERNSSYIRLLEASVLSSIGRFDQARTILEQVTRAEPDNIDAYFILSAIEGATGRTRQEQAALEQIIQLEPQNEEALIGLGNLHLRNRAMQNAIRYFDRVISFNPRSSSALLGQARALRMNSQWDEAESILDRTIELFPNLAEARTERSRYHWGRGQLVPALADLDEARRLAPQDYWISIDRGTLLLEMMLLEEALEEFNRAISINPGEFRAYIFSAGLKDDLGDPDGAAHDYAVLSRLRPEYYFALEGLGLHMMRQEKWEEARDAFMEAYTQSPEDFLYALLGVVAWMKMGDITAPRDYINQVIPRLRRDSLEWHMFRLYLDLTNRNYIAERDMVTRLDREENSDYKARMLFFMAQYYDIRENTTMANNYFRQIGEMNTRRIPEWRLNEWILAARGISVR